MNKEKKKLLRHCTVDSGGFVTTNPRLEVALSSVNAPPEVELGFDFSVAWIPEAGGRLERLCTQLQMGGGERDALEREEANEC